MKTLAIRRWHSDGGDSFHTIGLSEKETRTTWDVLNRWKELGELNSKGVTRYELINVARRIPVVLETLTVTE